MAKHGNKQRSALQSRIEAFNKTVGRQERRDFRPNATGGMHKVHRPGSMNRHKGNNHKANR